MCSPVYLLKGSQSLLIDREIEKIKEKFLKSESKINYFVYDSSTNSLSEVIENANTFSMFDENKIILVKNCEKYSSKELKHIDEYINSPNKHACVILVSNDDKKPNLKSKDNLVVKSFSNVQEIPRKILDESKKLNLKLTSKAAYEIHKMLGEDLNLINFELYKISQYFGTEHKIGEQDIVNYVSRKNFDDIFELINSISNKNKNKAIKVLSDLENQNHDPLSILNTIIWRFRQIHTVKNFETAKMSNEEIAKKISVSKGAVYYLLKQSKNFTKSQLSNILVKLNKLDLKYKSTYQDNYNLLTKLVFDICS